MTDEESIATWHVRGMYGVLAYLGVLVIAAISSSVLGAAVLTLVAVIAIASLALGAARHSIARLGDVTLFVWPVLAITALTWCVAISHDAASLILGVYVLSFLFVGVTQPARRSWWLIVPATASLWYALDLPAHKAIIRVALSIVVWALVAAWPARLLAQVREQRRLLEHAAQTDALTGLNNRTHLDDHLDAVDQTSSLLLIDLDYFKEYNDLHGHMAGDQLLREFASMLTEQCRSADEVYRYGGEEFLVLLPRTTTGDAREVSERLAFEWSTHASGSTFSAGISEAGVTGLAQADLMLYDAKRNGRNRTVVATSGSVDPLHDRIVRH